MPRGDRTGPGGLGPMTGRGAGYCAGYDAPGYVSGGGGRGWRNMYCATGLPGWMRGGEVAPRNYGAVNPTIPPVGVVPDEATALKAQAEYLDSVLNDIRKRLSELEAGSDE